MLQLIVLLGCLLARACPYSWPGARQLSPLLHSTARPGQWEGFFDSASAFDDDSFSLATRADFDPAVEGIYGELLPSSLTALLSEQIVTLTSADVFYDLGCGTGKVVAQMALETEVGRAVGIELGDRRYELAAAALHAMRAAASASPSSPSDGAADFALGVSKMSYLKGDLLAHTWSDATVLFVNAFCYPPALMRAIERRVKRDCPRLRFLFLFGQRFREDMTLAVGRHYENYLSPEEEGEEGEKDGEEGEEEGEWARREWPFNLYPLPAPMSFADETECQLYVARAEFR